MYFEAIFLIIGCKNLAQTPTIYVTSFNRRHQETPITIIFYGESHRKMLGTEHGFFDLTIKNMT